MASPTQRVLQATSCTLKATFLDSNGTGTDPTGPLTVHVTKGDGTDLLAPGTAGTITGDGSGSVTVNLTAAQTAGLNLLTAVWSAAAGATVTSHHEIVGGFIFSIADVRASDSTLTDTAKYPDALILTTRQQVEEELEWICDVAFVPRYARAVLDGPGTNELLLSDNKLRSIRSATIYSTIGVSPSSTALSVADLAALSFDIGDWGDGLVARTNYKIWDLGQGNITVEYERGWDGPKADLKQASLVRCRQLLNASLSGIPDRATAFSAAEGGTYRLDQPGIYKTGYPAVDAIYARHSFRSRGETEGPRPVSMTLRPDPNRYSLFHAGRH